MLNDGLEPNRSPSPKRKRRQKIRPKANGPSATRTSAHAQSMINKQRNSNPETPEQLNKETELADLEKIMDSFDAEEEKIIGTIVKLDCDSSQGILDSPPPESHWMRMPFLCVRLAQMDVILTQLNLTYLWKE